MWIKDYMNPNVGNLIIAKDSTIADASKLMVDNKTNSLLVVNEEKKPIGIISARNLINYIIPAYLKDDPSYSKFGVAGTFDKGAEENKDKCIADVMVTDFHCLAEDDTMIEAATYSGKEIMRTLPVINEEGVLTGFVSRTAVKIALYNAIYPDNKIEKMPWEKNQEA